MGSSYWLNVNDESSARFAVRMGGQPVLLMGLNSFLFCIIGFLQGSLSNGFVTCVGRKSLGSTLCVWEPQGS